VLGEDATGTYAGDRAELALLDTREDLDSFIGQAPTTRRRSRLRRRLRHLRRVREVLLRDLGGYVLEVHKAGAEGAGAGVVEGKLDRLRAVDAEIRELEGALDDRRPLVVREVGIGGTCPECGEIFGSEARFCWACGNAVAAGAGAAPQLSTASARPDELATAEEPPTPSAPPETELPTAEDVARTRP
jgi:hypothetical protein